MLQDNVLAVPFDPGQQMLVDAFALHHTLKDVDMNAGDDARTMAIQIGNPGALPDADFECGVTGSSMSNVISYGCRP